MRTGIYVYEPTTLTITATEQVVLTSLDNRTISFEKTGVQSTEVPPGVYKAITSDAISVTGANIEVVSIPDDKDPFPDASAKATKAFNLSSTTVTSFFKVIGLKAAAL